MRYRAMTLASIAMIACLTLMTLDSAQAWQGRVTTRWSDRLEALRPSKPLEYFELAEEVADASTQGKDLDLAKHLYALAGALDPHQLGRSACLALADLETDEFVKRRLVALASLLVIHAGGVWGPNGSSLSDPSTFGRAAAVAASEALSHYRKGNGTQALKSLSKPGVMELLQSYDSLLPGGFARFAEDCKLYKGQQKPTLSSGEMSRMLWLEAAILGGGERTWASELILTNGQPLIDVDPDHLEESLGVDITRPIYRSGRWVER